MYVHIIIIITLLCVYILQFGLLSHKYTGGCEFIDPTLLMSVRYGFYGEEWEEESVSELDADLNKDSSERPTDENSMYSSYDELEDPHLCEDVLCMI